jgi:3-hydroxybutyryl-CoA dehydrogenase
MHMAIGSIGIVGAGLMGSGIAQVCAAAGIGVTLYDISESAVQHGLAGIAANLERQVGKQKISAAEAAAIVDRIRGATEMAELSGCDFLIEAATEHLATKQDILRRLDGVARPGSIIATNTSSVSITKLAACLADPARLVGMHFFNPVPVMALVEVIRAIQTSDATAAATCALAERIGKTAISARNAPGFVVNRVWCR